MKHAFKRLGTATLGLVLAAASSLAVAQQPAQTQMPKIAIALFGPHPTLHQLIDGFKAELSRQGFKPTYDEGHVNFDRSLAPQLLNKLAAGNPDLMLTITTPLTQTAKQALANRKFPIVFGSVTDPVGAKLVPSADKGDTLMTGGSNIPSMDATVTFIKQLMPQVKRLGFIYNPGDDSDLGFLRAMEAAANKHQVELVKVGVDNANDIPARVQSFQGRVDALMVPASSLLIPAAPAIASVANRMKLPTFSPNLTNVAAHHFLGAMTVEYTRLGTTAGKIAADILRGKSPADIPVAIPTAADHEMKISGVRMKDLGIQLPASLKDCNCIAN
ncbi:ABC transporter substrate-binding protein [Ramlibacter sp. AW1]|uniref:ABC transporter substrate-binding protein n=1 Tax=Ramlibacter aurantiacus TaxID=2801330 RepID=A0A937D3V1_9BURK|nr:ABC transporter substrate-binding protein [Ramlibacter aurantiacus]MBL0421085.1 ABC transporter substrate-binding protein [Ramlibacter aurantiacus]